MSVHFGVFFFIFRFAWNVKSNLSHDNLLHQHILIGLYSKIFFFFLIRNSQHFIVRNTINWVVMKCCRDLFSAVFACLLSVIYVLWRDNKQVILMVSGNLFMRTVYWSRPWDSSTTTSWGLHGPFSLSFFHSFVRVYIFFLKCSHFEMGWFAYSLTLTLLSDIFVFFHIVGVWPPLESVFFSALSPYFIFIWRVRDMNEELHIHTMLAQRLSRKFITKLKWTMTKCNAKKKKKIVLHLCDGIARKKMCFFLLCSYAKRKCAKMLGIHFMWTIYWFFRSKYIVVAHLKWNETKKKIIKPVVAV